MTQQSLLVSQPISFRGVAIEPLRITEPLVPRRSEAIAGRSSSGPNTMAKNLETLTRQALTESTFPQILTASRKRGGSGRHFQTGGA
jgi:hypothetical protein